LIRIPSFTLTLVIGILTLSGTSAPRTSDAQTITAGDQGYGLGAAAVEWATTDSQTRWAFRTITPAIVSSPIIRLRDVIQPLDPNMAGWQRLSRSPVGLVPLDGKAMVMLRERLAKAIRRAEATPAAIDWVGPVKIEVVYRPSAQAPSQVVPTAYHHLSGTNRQSSGVEIPTSALLPKLPPAAIRSILSQVDRALNHQHPSVIESFVIEIDPRQAELTPLDSMVGVPQIEFVDPPVDGECRIRVVGQTYDDPCVAVLRAKLTAHPKVVFPKATYQRGHRLRYEDLTLKPISDGQVDGTHVSDVSELIGMEVRRSVRAGRPISRSDVGSPILVRRSDLVEIRVIGGGVSVTTNGKAMEEGAESDTIEVETLSPRKRMLARVVQSGLVEIVTRAPGVN
jgi:flagella basal body P-ring formation protein FlgA